MTVKGEGGTGVPSGRGAIGLIQGLKREGRKPSEQSRATVTGWD